MKDLVVITSPLYFTSKAVVETYKDILQAGGDVLFVVTDEENYVFPVDRRVTWLEYSLGTRALNVLSIKETDSSPKDEDFWGKLDFTIRTFMKKKDDKDIPQDSLYTLVFERADFEEEVSPKNSSYVELETYKGLDVVNTDHVRALSHSTFNNLFDSEYYDLVNPKKKELNLEYDNFIFPVLTIGANKYALVSYNVVDGGHGMLPSENIPVREYASVLYNKLGCEVAEEDYLKFFSDKGSSTRVLISEINGDNSEAIKEMTKGSILMFDPTHELKIVPLHVVKTLSKEFALIHNLYEQELGEEVGPDSLEDLLGESKERVFLDSKELANGRN